MPIPFKTAIPDCNRCLFGWRIDYSSITQFLSDRPDGSRQLSASGHTQDAVVYCELCFLRTFRRKCSAYPLTLVNYHTRRLILESRKDRPPLCQQLPNWNVAVSGHHARLIWKQVSVGRCRAQSLSRPTSRTINILHPMTWVVSYSKY